MPERITFKGKYLSQSEAARHFQADGGETLWIPKSVFTYYSNDGEGNVKFSVEGWKVRDVQAKNFEEE